MPGCPESPDPDPAPGTGQRLTHTAYLSVGSNVGDKAANCRGGIRALGDHPQVAVRACSRYYRTAPVDYTDQDWFVNAAVRVATDLPPEALLDWLLAVEKAAGRDRRGVRFGPRILDLDIIFYDRLVLQTPRLTLPHPRMHNRRFVLQPICDMDPLLEHPVLRVPLQALLARITDPRQEVRPLDD